MSCSDIIFSAPAMSFFLKEREKKYKNDPEMVDPEFAVGEGAEDTKTVGSSKNYTEGMNAAGINHAFGLFIWSSRCVMELDKNTTGRISP